MITTNYHIYPVGDHALTIDFGNDISSELNNQVLNLFQLLRADPLPGTIDVVPAYSSLTIVYDLLQVASINPGALAYNEVYNRLRSRLQNIRVHEHHQAGCVTIPVCYHSSLAPDLEFVAAQHQLSVDDVIAIHAAGRYRVYMIGFLPGFPYMGKVDQRIATPRRQQPRTLVAAGSVGIAGRQTGIYPFPSPGGWQLIGRTPTKMFDALHQNPTLLNPGDEVQFEPVSLHEFNRMSS